MGKSNVPPTWYRFTLQAIASAVTVVSAGLLVALGYLGRFVRPTSDDWCALWKTRDMGVFGITKDFYETQNGRVANAFVSGLVDVDGVTGMKLLPAFLVVTFGVGMVLLLRELSILIGWRVPLVLLTAIAGVTEVLLFAAAQNPYQALLWAPATISHTLPIVIALWTVALALWCGRSGPSWVRGVSLGAVVLVGFFLGTLNEPFVVIGGLAAAATGLLVLPWFRFVRRWYAFAWCVAACVGLIAGYAVLFTSPGAQWRRAQNPDAAPLLSAANLQGSYHDWLKVVHILAAQWTYLAAVAIGLAVGLLVSGRASDEGDDDAERPRPLLFLKVVAFLMPIPVVLVASFVIILGVRQGYGPTGWTYYRTWFSFVAPMVFTLCAYGVVAGRALRRVLESRAGSRALVGGLVAATLAAAFAFAGVVSLTPRVENLHDAATTRAAKWDKQNSRINKQAAAGATTVSYRPLNIANLAEPFYTSVYSRDWVAACTAKWYDVDRLKRLR
jgi:hypothetical protein